jgi:uncharacterized protein involved in exopolysaccharide biosynthesis
MSDNTNEVGFRELILTAKEYISEIKKSWLTILIITIPIMIGFGFTAMKRKSTYPAALTFMLNDEKGGGSFASILGQFGGLMGDNDSPLDKILELAASRRIISSALFEKYNLDGNYDFFANHIIRSQNFHEDWGDDKLIKDFLFTHGNIDSFNLAENKALQSIHARFTGKDDETSIFSTRLSKKTTIMTLSLETREEMLSIELLKTIYDKICAFYILQSVQREGKTLDILKTKRDSISRILANNDFATAKLEEKNNALLYETPKVPIVRVKRNNQLLSGLYYETVKNTELADFALKSSTPYLTLVDGPIPPIQPIKPGRLKLMVIGLFLSLMISAVYVVIRKLIRSLKAKL